jgi:hypothetical protein
MMMDQLRKEKLIRIFELLTTMAQATTAPVKKIA